MTVNTMHRSNDPEIMDDFAMEGEELKEALDKIAKINRLLGGNKVTLQGVKNLLQQKDKLQTITIVDLGCGNGDMLRMLADYGKKQDLNVKLIGIDANSYTISHAERLSIDYHNISFCCQDVFDKSFEELDCDIILCTLFLHHFKEEEILKLLSQFYDMAKLGLVINDLQRNKLAYRLFQLVCFVFRLSTMTKLDGLISILRGFKKKEIIDFAAKINFRNYSLKWKWAFRYQWIILKA
jgi:2-polyprenyl-3-methyl-5-hydroxy-6-metoxy-1,4-benzoquinol methylase